MPEGSLEDRVGQTLLSVAFDFDIDLDSEIPTGQGTASGHAAKYHREIPASAAKGIVQMVATVIWGSGQRKTTHKRPRLSP